MCDKSGKCQAEKSLQMDCSQIDFDCDFFKPIPTVPEIEEIEIGDDVIGSIDAVTIEDLVDAKFSGKDITNPEFLNVARKAKACDRFIKDITND